MTLPFKRVFGQNLAIFAHFWAFSVTFLAVTAIYVLTLGTGRTCIILRHIPSWFEAVLAIAILQSCAQRGPKWPFWGQKWPNMAGLPMSQSGLRGPKMIPDDQYNMFLTIWGHLGPNLAYKKILGKFTKVLGFGKSPPPCWEKFPNNIVFFGWARTLAGQFAGSCQRRSFSRNITHWVGESTHRELKKLFNPLGIICH